MVGYVIMNVDMAKTKYFLSQMFIIDCLLMVLPIWFVYHVCDHEIHPYRPRVCKLKDLSGALFDTDTNAIMLEGEHYLFLT
jgi:fumarate reductase subunit D